MSPGKIQSESTNNQSSQRRVLASWKDIANYVGKGVRTVQRWELIFDLPIRRPGDHGSNAVVAFTDEIDLWFGKRFKERVDGGSQSELQQLRKRNTELLAENKTLRRMLKQQSSSGSWRNLPLFPRKVRVSILFQWALRTSPISFGEPRGHWHSQRENIIATTNCSET